MLIWRLDIYSRILHILMDHFSFMLNRKPLQNMMSFVIDPCILFLTYLALNYAKSVTSITSELQHFSISYMFTYVWR